MLKVDKTTTTKAVQKLIDSGYFHKQKDTSDNRAFQLYPTLKALKVYDLLIEDENENINLCFNGFTPAEIEQAGQLIQRMNANMESVWYGLKKGK
jgi:DNA-binding MarR family transcriptional regulator